MYDYKDILAKLEAGENAEEMAKAYVDALNKAVEEKNKADAAKANAGAKRKDAQHIADAVSGYICRWHGSTEQISAEDVEGIFDNVFKLADAVKKLDQTTFPLKKKGNADEAIKSFLNELGF